MATASMPLRSAMVFTVSVISASSAADAVSFAEGGWSWSRMRCFRSSAVNAGGASEMSIVAMPAAASATAVAITTGNGDDDATLVEGTSGGALRPSALSRRRCFRSSAVNAGGCVNTADLTASIVAGRDASVSSSARLACFSASDDDEPADERERLASLAVGGGFSSSATIDVWPFSRALSSAV